MEIKPVRSFNQDSLAADFPAAVLLFHSDDFDTASPRRWASRTGNVVMTFAADAVKDENGIYTLVNNSVASVSGTMPTLSGYAALVVIGNLKNNDASAGLLTTVGSANPGPRLTASGIATSNAPADLNSIVALTGSISATTADPGTPACMGAYFDLVDTSSPLIARALASGLSTDQAIPNGSTTSTSTGQIVLGAALDATFTLGAFAANNDGRRTKIVALLDFGTELTANQFQIACAEMARTGELFAGWRERA